MFAFIKKVFVKNYYTVNKKKAPNQILNWNNTEETEGENCERHKPSVINCADIIDDYAQWNCQNQRKKQSFPDLRLRPKR